MGKRTDRGTFIREVITEVLSRATEPQTAVDIHGVALFAGTNVTIQDVTMTCFKAVSAGKPWLKRVRVAKGKSRWAYYLPGTSSAPLEDRPRKPAVQPEDVFKFDPVPEALLPTPPQSQQPITFEAPVGVKAITIRAGATSILIELDTLPGAR